jgi:hypothetical protein
MPIMPGFSGRQLLAPIDPSKVESLKFSFETTGFLFPCPPPTDALQVPNNIDVMINMTTMAFIPEIDSIKKKIEDSLSCPPKEKFINMTYNTEGFDDATADPALQEQRIQVLQIKADALKKAILEPQFVKFTTNVKILRELKAKAQSGQGSTNCSS